MIEELSELHRHHRVATVHVADVLMDHDGDETRTGQSLAGDGSPTSTRDSVVVSGRKQAVERRQALAERRIPQIVAPAAEFAEGRRVVAGQRLFVLTSARSGGRLDEAGDVDVVETLGRRTSQTAEQTAQQSAAQLTFHASKFGPETKVKSKNVIRFFGVSNFVMTGSVNLLFQMIEEFTRSVL